MWPWSERLKQGKDQKQTREKSLLMKVRGFHSSTTSFIGSVVNRVGRAQPAVHPQHLLMERVSGGKLEINL